MPPLEQVVDGVHRAGTDWVNWYLLEGDDGVTIVDCGFPGYRSQVVPALESIGRSPEDVKAVVLTHYHTDHVGAVERIRAESGATVHAPSGDAAGIRGDAKVPLPNGLIGNIWRPGFFRYMLHAGRNGGTKAEPVGEVSEYADGDILEAPGRPRAVHVPGHTAGHFALLFEGHGVLVAGDALATAAWMPGPPGPRQMPVNEDHELAAESLSRLEGLDAGAVVFGHGDPFRGTPSEAVARARSN